MKLCFFSDIHGNKAALDASYPLILKEKADFNIFLGDICGYYFDVLECFDLLRSIPNLIAIRGNHDDLFLNYLDVGVVSEEYTLKYGPSLHLLLQLKDTKLGKEFKYWLGSLKNFYENDELGFACFHASPESGLESTKYIYPDTVLPEISCQPLVVLGHTHYPMARKQGTSLFCNPGSIGQPRNGGLPSFATIDTVDMAWQIHHFSYNIEDYLKSMQKYHPFPDYLVDVLRRSI